MASLSRSERLVKIRAYLDRLESGAEIRDDDADEFFDDVILLHGETDIKITGWWRTLQADFAMSVITGFILAIAGLILWTRIFGTPTVSPDLGCPIKLKSIS